MITAMLYAIAALFWAVVGTLGIFWVAIPLAIPVLLLLRAFFGWR